MTSPRRYGRVAIVLSDTRAPFLPADQQRSPPYFPLAVALAAHYARTQCYDLRVYRLMAPSGPKAIACAHPDLGPRHPSWCKLVAVHHTLWTRAEPGSASPVAASSSVPGGASPPGAAPTPPAAFLYNHALFMDSDIFWHDVSRSVPALVRDFSPSPHALDAMNAAAMTTTDHSKPAAGKATRAPFAWFASNAPYGLQPHQRFSLDKPGRSHANAAFFILRNGASSRRFVADWWSYDFGGVGSMRYAFNFRPWFEQCSLSHMWPHPGCVVLNGTSGEWKHMLKAGTGGALNASMLRRSGVPVVHVDSSSGRYRGQVARRLWDACMPACAPFFAPGTEGAEGDEGQPLGAAAHEATQQQQCAASAGGPPRFYLIRIPRNFSSNLTRGTPDGMSADEWFGLPSNHLTTNHWIGWYGWRLAKTSG